jgi:hypothetical protein
MSGDRLFALFIGVLSMGPFNPRVRAAEPSGKVDFGRDIYPVLRAACFECHGPEKQKATLRLDSRAAMLRGGDSGPAIIPGKAQQSELYQRIARAKGEEGIMPARGEPLSPAQRKAIRQWIDQGARWSDTMPSRHWAYVKPVRRPLPAVKHARWPRNPVDYFILARLESERLTPTPVADRPTLIRRLSLDLTGLPPTVAEVDQWLNDKSPDAYEKLVDRLLASPQFGPRWARPWLDLARYADSHGFQRDDLREVWAFRDWVVDALNRDMPFDQFTIEQIAGDLLPNARESQRIATGFHRCTPINVEAGTEPEETRVNQVIDRVNTTASTWLGTTLECAQCHNHKYDPFTQKDYYQFFAFFNNTVLEAQRANSKAPGSIRFLGPNMLLRSPENDAERARLRGEIAALDEKLQARRKDLGKDLTTWEATLAEVRKNAPRKHTLDIADFASAAGATYRVLKDRSVLLLDDPPDKDTYTITVQTKLRGITAFELEALTDASLPGGGPGRGDPKRPNFVLNTFAATIAPLVGGERGARSGDRVERPAPSAVRFRAARASFSQKGFDVAGAIDGNPKTAWAIAPQFRKTHWARFETDRPLGFEEGTEITFKLVQEFGAGRTIGRVRLSALTGDLKREAIPTDVIAILETPREKRTPAQVARLLDFRLEQDAAAAKLRGQRARLDQAVRTMKPPSTLVMQELPTPRTTTIFVRGDYKNAGAKVNAGAPAILHALPKGPPNRLTLARWLVDRDNPLTARVHVNRLWAELFGRGIVSTVEDFGVKGEPPTHPELLDWLAVDFMENGWSMKKLLRTIVTSSTYRQSSRLTRQLLARDDQNKLHARGPRYRMDAEMIRDNALFAAGLLSPHQGGRPVRPYQPDGLWVKIGGTRLDYILSPGEARYRRGIYVVWKRASPYPSMVNFDATARLACTVKRSRSNTPLQALTLLNDPVYVEAALALARRAWSERKETSDESRIKHAFRLCLVREPRAGEVRVLRRLLEHQRKATTPETAGALIGAFALPAGCTAKEFAAWYAVATALLNLDEMITKG